MTEGIVGFTTNPYVFTTLERARSALTESMPVFPKLGEACIHARAVPGLRRGDHAGQRPRHARLWTTSLIRESTANPSTGARMAA